MDGAQYTPIPEPKETCGGTWNFPDVTSVHHGAADNDLDVKFMAGEDDTVGCFMGDYCFDWAEGSTSVTLVDDAEAFVATGSVHLYPLASELEMTVYFVYSVTYHS